MTDAHERALHLMAGWVAAIADNIQNPVAGIGAALDLIERRLPAEARADATTVEALTKIRARLAALSAYVAELSTFARPAAPRPSDIDVAATLDAAVHEARAHAARGAHLTVDLETGLRDAVADGPALQTMIKALVLNALEAVPPTKTPVVRVVARRDGDALAVSVEDNGEGFAPEIHDRAFEAFFSTKEAGTGLGLAVVRKHAQAHGGAVALGTSPTLGGALVTLRLPGALK